MVSDRLQIGCMPKHALLNFFIVKKSEKVASLLHQLSAFNEPMSHLRKCGIEDVLLDAMAQHARNRLDRYFPSALRGPTVTSSQSATSLPTSYCSRYSTRRNS